jgi:hypothetical protein
VNVPYFRQLLLGACLGAPLAFAGCSQEAGVPQSFPPLHYSYLAPISLNVSNIVTQVNYVPPADGSSVDNLSPETPLQAVQAMIQDRLVASGSSGTATVQVNDASLRRVGDTVVATVAIHLTVRSADGLRTGYTDATVTRTRTTPDDTSPEAFRAFLYSITQDMMNAENVQLEYQIRQNLGAWLVGGVSAVGGAAAPVPVQTQDLGSGSLPPLTATPDTGMPAVPGAPTPLVPVAPPAGYVAPPAPVYGIQPPAAPPMPMAMPAPAVVAPTINPDTMPGGSVGLPAGNPVPTPSGADQIGAQPVTTMPGSASTPELVPSAAPPAPPAASSSSTSSGALPPLPPGITP